MIPIDLTGHLALITGASGELGRVITRTLAQAGADVVIHYHKAADRALALEKQVTALGRRALVCQADVTVADQVLAMRDAVAKAIGKPDIIVNNSVIQYKWASILEQPEADYESQYRSSVLHNVLMAKAFVPAMIERRWGRVIGINTECVMQCTPTQGAYVSGKRGMDGVLRVLAREVGEHGITVNQVAPGWMISETRPAFAEDASYRQKVPMQRRGYDQDIANAVAWLASDLASFVSGVYLPVAGGNVMPTI